MQIVAVLGCASLWLVVLLSGTYCGVSVDGGSDTWVADFFACMLSLALACTGAVLLWWGRQHTQLRNSGWLMLVCSVVVWLSDGVLAAALMVLFCLVYAGWAVWQSIAQAWTRPPSDAAGFSRRMP